MDYCKNCKRWTCGAQGTSHEMSIPCGNYIPPTNADLIRAMSDEELAEKIAAQVACMECPILEMCKRAEPRRCIDMWLSWLKSPVEEVDNG